MSYGEAQNNLAWVLATHPDPGLRNGEEAIRLVTAAVKAGSGNAASLLDTMAAAHAEQGHFDQAVGIAKKAIEIAEASGHRERAHRIESRLRLYESGQPFRDE